MATQFEEIAEAIKRYHPSPNLDLLKSAYDFAQHAHEGQVRASGEPYLLHLVEVAKLAANLKLDLPSIIAALLHDTLEDCSVGFSDLVSRFGGGGCQNRRGGHQAYPDRIQSREEKQAENFRKMLIAMAKDIRVVLVKLCDRLHNMQTLGFVSEEKRRRIAQETLDIYAPLANRLGIHWLKSELEDSPSHEPSARGVQAV